MRLNWCFYSEMPLFLPHHSAGEVVHSRWLLKEYTEAYPILSSLGGTHWWKKRHKLWETRGFCPSFTYSGVYTQFSRQGVKRWRAWLCHWCIRLPCDSYCTSLCFLITPLACIPPGDCLHSADSPQHHRDPAFGFLWPSPAMPAITSCVVYCSPLPLNQLLTLQNLQGLMVFHGKEVELHFSLYLCGSPTSPMLRASVRSVIAQQKGRKQWVLAWKWFFFCRHFWWKQKSWVCQNGTGSATAEGGSSNLLFLIQFVSATWLPILLPPFWSQTALSVQSGCTSCPCRKQKPQEKTEAPIKHCSVCFRSDGFPVVKKNLNIKLKHQWKCDHTWTRKSTLIMCIQCLLPCCRSIGFNHFAGDVLLWDLSMP